MAASVSAPSAGGVSSTAISQSPRCDSNVRTMPGRALAVAQHRRLLGRELRIGADDAELHGSGGCDRAHAEAAATAEERARALAVDDLEPEGRGRRSLRIEIDSSVRWPPSASAHAMLIALVVLPTPPFRLTTATTCTPRA